MFYSDTTQAALKSVCAQTLRRQGLNPEVAMWAAADNALSYNYTVWTLDSASQPNRINKIVAFGDSLSDTQNVYNASQWLLPNRNSWFLGRFSNGYTWVEYLAEELKLPLYNWAVGGAGTDTEKVVISGVTDQVKSWKEYMQKAQGYRPENTLFTVLIGGNDFVNYDRSVEHVITNQTKALQNLIDAGARHILLLKLPDVSRAPIFKYKGNTAVVTQKVEEYNRQLVQLASDLNAQNGGSLDIQLFDSYSLFNDLLNNPSRYGMTDTTTPCLNINGSSQANYLGNPGPRAECRNPDAYVFWDVLHPTTRIHQLLSEHITPFVRSHFSLATP
ncbi:SGNH/GDSL hydrolase family protein [Chitinimonas sp. PSY-7]|uniref:SGNH/GDSL hydrolase family protein n=1 Tax=Chitinimonas sp. PSY-7 TaxID=3459088 RepID=UPI0040400F8F